MAGAKEKARKASERRKKRRLIGKLRARAKAKKEAKKELGVDSDEIDSDMEIETLLKREDEVKKKKLQRKAQGKSEEKKEADTKNGSEKEGATKNKVDLDPETKKDHDTNPAAHLDTSPPPPTDAPDSKTGDKVENGIIGVNEKTPVAEQGDQGAGQNGQVHVKDS